MLTNQNISGLIQQVEIIKDKIPELRGGDPFARKMLERALRPFLLVLAEENISLDKEDMRPENIIYLAADIMGKNRKAIDAKLLQIVQERYAVNQNQKIVWLEEVKYLSSQYNHPLTTLRAVVLKNLSEDGKAASAQQSFLSVTS